MKKDSEKRQHPRYETKVKVYFEIDYDLETNVKFQMIGPGDGISSRQYSGVSRNVSVEGMCFSSNIKLNKGEKLKVEVYLPNAKEPIRMEGEVRWSKSNSQDKESSNGFDTGLRLVSVEGKRVVDSIHYDEKYQVYWSEVLESILGKFKEIGKKRAAAV